MHRTNYDHGNLWLFNLHSNENLAFYKTVNYYSH